EGAGRSAETNPVEHQPGRRSDLPELSREKIRAAQAGGSAGRERVDESIQLFSAALRVCPAALLQARGYVFVQHAAERYYRRAADTTFAGRLAGALTGDGRLVRRDEDWRVIAGVQGRLRQPAFTEHVVHGAERRLGDRRTGGPGGGVERGQAAGEESSVAESAARDGRI